MNIDFSGNSLENIAALVGGLIALGLALQAGVGPTLMYLTEAFKDAFGINTGKGGLLAILLGSLMGVGFGMLTAVLTEANTNEYLGLGLIGLFSGMFMGAGAIQTHKASALVNTEASAAIETVKTVNTENLAFQDGYATGHGEGLRTAGYNVSTLADVDEPWRGPGLATVDPAGENPDTEEDDITASLEEGPGEFQDEPKSTLI